MVSGQGNVLLALTLCWPPPAIEVSLVCGAGWWIGLWDLTTRVLISRAHCRGMYLVPKLPNWYHLLVLVRADPMALVLLTLWSGRMGISAKSSHPQADSWGTEGGGMAWSSDGTGALQGCREIRNQL